MKRYAVAIDIGASSGRIFRSPSEREKVRLEVVHAFPNGVEEQEGHLVWDYDRLFQEIVTGLGKLEKGSVASVSIDTWGVDFVLLDDQGRRIGPSYSYRDHRSDHVLSPVDEAELYRITGIQHLSFNTIYQLLALKAEHPEYLERASVLLQVPDYLSYLLTGEISQEYTNATTTSLVNAQTQQWDFSLINRLGLPTRLFRPLSQPGERIGMMRKELVEKLGYDAVVLHAASHDTASAVLGMPLKSTSAFLSSGTWSLIGAEIPHPILSEQSRRENYSNEGGTEGSIRYLKNVMGLWLMQCLHRESGLSYDAMEEKAKQHIDTTRRIDVFDNRFTSPKSMREEILRALNESGQGEPTSDGELFAVVYQSLTDGYKKALEALERITALKRDNLVMVGGGTKDDLLCALTEEKLGIPLKKGATEGTATGNILSQLIALGVVKDKAEARLLIA